MADAAEVGGGIILPAPTPPTTILLVCPFPFPFAYPFPFSANGPPCDVLDDPNPTESFDPNGVIGLELFGLYSDLFSPPLLEWLDPLDRFPSLSRWLSR